MENNPTKRYDIYGVVYNTACRMPSDQRNDPWLLCSAICGALDEYLEKLAREQLIRVSPRVNTTNDGMMLFNIFDTEHTDDIPVDIKPKKAKYEKELPGTMPIQVNQDGLPIPEIIWREKPFNLDKCYLGKYSNPCTTSLGQCRKPCVQTELWLYDKKTDYLTVVDVEFADLESLHRSLDPWV